MRQILHKLVVPQCFIVDYISKLSRPDNGNGNGSQRFIVGL